MLTMTASPDFTQGLLTAVLAGHVTVARAWTSLSALGVTPTRLLALVQVFPGPERNALRRAFARSGVRMPPQTSLPPRSSTTPPALLRVHVRGQRARVCHPENQRRCL